ncbi:MAG: LysE family transporter [Crocinitomicaceae bacterium]|nr:LysE family transporter [Crocinitomicaceae bacterium]
MSEIIFKAVVMGLALAMLPGPAFFVLLQTSIKNGIRSAMAFDIGILVADIIYILVAYLFYAEVQNLAGQKDYLTLAGGIIFAIFGISFFVNIRMKHKKSKPKEEKPKQYKKEGSYWVLFLKGLLLNGFNPFVIFYWLGVITFGSDEVDAEGNQMLWFLTIILITFFSIDALKILGAKSLQRFITPKFLKNLNRFIGVVFIIFGIASIVIGARGLM